MKNTQREKLFLRISYRRVQRILAKKKKRKHVDNDVNRPIKLFIVLELCYRYITLCKRYLDNSVINFTLLRNKVIYKLLTLRLHYKQIVDKIMVSF